MATADEYAQWIVNNEDKKGTADFNTVVEAYKLAQAEESASQQTQQGASPSLMPQAVSAVANTVQQMAAQAPEAMNAVRSGVQALGNMPAQQAARVAIDTASVMAGHPPYASILRTATDTAAGTPFKEVVGNAVNVAKQGLGAVGGAARGLGSALVSGAVAPESAFLMPYQMAAYEQDKIRANPNAAGLESNPYAQVQRGEYATTRQAGAANQRSAVRNQRYGGLTAEEQAILDKDRLNMQMRVQAAKRVLGQQ